MEFTIPSHEEILRICPSIQPYSSEWGAPYRCGSEEICLNVKFYGDNKYCGRMLRLNNQDYNPEK